MKRIFLISIFALFAVSYQSCDTVDDPIPKDLGTSLFVGGVEFILDDDLNITITEEDTSALFDLINNGSWVEQTAADNSATRFIVMEEFTGHTCLNCPRGTKEVVRLDSIYQEQLIPIGIHSGTFARPKSGDKYTTDFRVAGGHSEEYLLKYNPPGSGYPSAVVSRAKKLATGDSFWENEIKALENDIPLASLELKTYFDSTSNIIRANCKVVWKQSLPEKYNLQVFVLEDHVIDWQLDGQVDIEFYDHRHVLRKVVNGTFGKSLQPAVAGQSQQIEYIFPFTEAMMPNNNKNVEVVAFVFNNDPAAELNVIIQGNATKVLK